MRYLPLLVLAALMLAACDATVPSTPSASVSIEVAEATGDIDGPALAAVRAATSQYQRVERALADGWGVDPFPGDPNEAISPCVANPVTGDGMGHHYINFGLMDGELDPSTPEVLLYEPTKNGRFRLVGVEYIVPFGVEPRAADGGTAPELFGETFTESDGANGWALHVWIWRHNPAGMFADFNPNVSCEYATAPDA